MSAGARGEEDAAGVSPGEAERSGAGDSGRPSAHEWGGSEKEELLRDAVPRERDLGVPVKGRRGGQTPSFEEPHPTSYGRPDRWRLKSAYWSYVLGHDRGWTAERKRSSGEARVVEEERERLRHPPEKGAARPEEPAQDPLRARFGVPVPERFSFHRGPDTWRDRIRGLRRSTGRPEETRRGEEIRRGAETPPDDAPRKGAGG